MGQCVERDSSPQQRPETPSTVEVPVQTNGLDPGAEALAHLNRAFERLASSPSGSSGSFSSSGGPHAVATAPPSRVNTTLLAPGAASSAAPVMSAFRGSIAPAPAMTASPKDPLLISPAAPAATGGIGAVEASMAVAEGVEPDHEMVDDDAQVVWRKLQLDSDLDVHGFRPSITDVHNVLKSAHPPLEYIQGMSYPAAALVALKGVDRPVALPGSVYRALQTNLAFLFENDMECLTAAFYENFLPMFASSRLAAHFDRIGLDPPLLLDMCYRKFILMSFVNIEPLDVVIHNIAHFVDPLDLYGDPRSYAPDMVSAFVFNVLERCQDELLDRDLVEVSLLFSSRIGDPRVSTTDELEGALRVCDDVLFQIRCKTPEDIQKSVSSTRVPSTASSRRPSFGSTSSADEQRELARERSCYVVHIEDVDAEEFISTVHADEDAELARLLCQLELNSYVIWMCLTPSHAARVDDMCRKRSPAAVMFNASQASAISNAVSHKLEEAQPESPPEAFNEEEIEEVAKADMQEAVEDAGTAAAASRTVENTAAEVAEAAQAKSMEPQWQGIRVDPTAKSKRVWYGKRGSQSSLRLSADEYRHGQIAAIRHHVGKLRPLLELLGQGKESVEVSLKNMSIPAPMGDEAYFSNMKSIQKSVVLRNDQAYAKSIVSTIPHTTRLAICTAVQKLEDTPSGAAKLIEVLGGIDVAEDPWLARNRASQGSSSSLLEILRVSTRDSSLRRINLKTITAMMQGLLQLEDGEVRDIFTKHFAEESAKNVAGQCLFGTTLPLIQSIEVPEARSSMCAAAVLIHGHESLPGLTTRAYRQVLAGRFGAKAMDKSDAKEADDVYATASIGVVLHGFDGQRVRDLWSKGLCPFYDGLGGQIVLVTTDVMFKHLAGIGALEMKQAQDDTKALDFQATLDIKRSLHPQVSEGDPDGIKAKQTLDVKEVVDGPAKEHNVATLVDFTVLGSSLHTQVRCGSRESDSLESMIRVVKKRACEKEGEWLVSVEMHSPRSKPLKRARTEPAMQKI